MFRLRVRLRIRRCLRDMLLSRRDQGRKSIRIVHSHVGQDLPVQLNATHFQSMNQLAIGDAIVASGGADPLNPQCAVIALAHAAVTVGVPQRAVHRFFSRPIKFSLGEEKSFGVLQQFLAPRTAFCSTFNSRHSLISYCAPIKAHSRGFWSITKRGDKRGRQAANKPRIAGRVCLLEPLLRSGDFRNYRSNRTAGTRYALPNTVKIPVLSGTTKTIRCHMVMPAKYCGHPTDALLPHLPICACGGAS